MRELLRCAHKLTAHVSPHVITLLDCRVARYLDRQFAGPFLPFGLPPRSYEGSGATAPMFHTRSEWSQRLAEHDPQLHAYMTGPGSSDLEPSDETCRDIAASLTAASRR